LASAKEAISSAVTGGIESVKELIHDVKTSLEPEETRVEDRQNPESPLTKEPMFKTLPFVSHISVKQHRRPLRHEEKKSLTTLIKEKVMKTLST